MTKYPRTPHLPWSPGATSDDKFIEDMSTLTSASSVVVTEKVDGENTTLTRDHVHARSLDSRDHPSRHWVKGLWSTIRHEIPEGFKICGENLWAVHSIEYRSLPSYFLVFAVFDEETVLSWEDTVAVAEMLGLHTVPVLYRGPWNEAAVRACMTGDAGSRCGGEQEGYVVRVASSFLTSGFGTHVAKYVRNGHVQTDQHWMHGPCRKNHLTTE